MPHDDFYPEYDDFYINGGTIPPLSLSYVERLVDQKIYQDVKAGKFCYVLASRQMGKSSLCSRLRWLLENNDGYACAYIDLSGEGFSSELTESEWYDTLIDLVHEEFDYSLLEDQKRWIEEHSAITPSRRWELFLTQVLLKKVSNRPVTIIIDEIDSLLELRKKSNIETDNFFQLIRKLHNKRHSGRIGRSNLTFVLLGVATPSQLIQNKQLTPFNIGQAIELEALPCPKSREEAKLHPLYKGMEDWVPNPSAMLISIFEWSGGQPFITQMLCKIVKEHAKKISTLMSSDQDEVAVEELVATDIIQFHEDTEIWEKNIAVIRDRLLAQKDKNVVLKLYRKILEEGSIPSSDSEDVMHLRLSGLVRKEGNTLKVFNRIYEEVFSKRWVDIVLSDSDSDNESFEELKQLLYRAERSSQITSRWLACIGASIAILAIVAAGYHSNEISSLKKQIEDLRVPREEELILPPVVPIPVPDTSQIEKIARAQENLIAIQQQLAQERAKLEEKERLQAQTIQEEQARLESLSKELMAARDNIAQAIRASEQELNKEISGNNQPSNRENFAEDEAFSENSNPQIAEEGSSQIESDLDNNNLQNNPSENRELPDSLDNFAVEDPEIQDIENSLPILNPDDLVASGNGFSSSFNINPGDRGEHVSDLQMRLGELDYFSADPTGTYDSSTEEAVRQFQIDRGLEVTGRIEPKTFASIIRLTTSGGVAASGSVEHIARDLAVLGFLDEHHGFKVAEQNFKELFGLTDLPGWGHIHRKVVKAALLFPGVQLDSIDSAGIISKNSSGLEVVRLQEHLSALGYFTDQITGFYGEQTEAALKKFQQHTGLAITGIIDPTTFAALLPESGDSTPINSTIPSSAETIALQTDLAELGFYRGPLDGIFNLQTEAAVRDFQAAYGLPIDGIVGINALAAIDTALASADLPPDTPAMAFGPSPSVPPLPSYPSPPAPFPQPNLSGPPSIVQSVCDLSDCMAMNGPFTMSLGLAPNQRPGVRIPEGTGKLFIYGNHLITDSVILDQDINSTAIEFSPPANSVQVIEQDLLNIAESGNSILIDKNNNNIVVSGINSEELGIIQTPNSTRIEISSSLGLVLVDSYVVLTPYNDSNDLELVRQYNPYAFLAVSDFGLTINAGSFITRTDAEDFSNLLRGEGLDSKVSGMKISRVSEPVEPNFIPAPYIVIVPSQIDPTKNLELVRQFNPYAFLVLSPDRGVVINAGSFVNRADAERYVAQLQDSGIDARVTYIDISDN
jgi:peptidoglycan hydrolase-like protein with peptidoglycan-binding domain